MSRIMLLVVASLLCANAAFSQDLRPVKHDGIAYVSGGVGEDERARMKTQMHGYNLFIIFAEKSGSYLADVEVVVKSLEGRKGFDTVSQGPFLYASLPSGKYKVSAEYKGKKQSRIVNLGKAHEVFYWK